MFNDIIILRKRVMYDRILTTANNKPIFFFFYTFKHYFINDNDEID